MRIEALVSDLNPENAEELLGGTDAILDGTDNFETRLLINDYSVRESVPWIYGAAVGSYGIAMPILPDDSACIRCVYPEPPSGVQPTCETAGVLGPVTSLIGSIQAMEALKILAGRRICGTGRCARVRCLRAIPNARPADGVNLRS